MAVNTLDTDSFEEKVLKAEGPVLVDFYADWCAPCKAAEPVLDELSEEYEGKVKFVKIDVDANPQTAQDHNVMSIPTTILFNDGNEAGRQIGFAGKDGFVNLLNKA